MKIIKNMAIVIVAILLIPFVIALFSTKDYSVVREITINKPQEEVYNYTKFLKNQDAFSKWASMDPNMQKEYKGTDGQIGFVSAWKSENPDVGSGEQEILAIQEGKRIDYALRFFEPFESDDKAFMEFEALNDSQTLVRWGFEGHFSYPMNAMLLVMDMEKMIGDDFQTGLENLKRILENY
ncbi:Polyketide cyclase / dehydrase and lipid transport [Aquiflexum balticum DSM 16537]|uniref:Polyketide cyclase / dehydrase and lipid transport n=1 Tax=Aquiflexum balticum DSM 16537 TaxID=758820 RepID=A0A1W2HAG0_9BACT|nr:SRPBCC family protein [Aquiflexum balticum]SMD45698.1 Polyketide cyclase / dehydrase and lipid transport [Aquiflexum balticum DSM 16537]